MSLATLQAKREAFAQADTPAAKLAAFTAPSPWHNLEIANGALEFVCKKFAEATGLDWQDVKILALREARERYDSGHRIGVVPSNG